MEKLVVAEEPTHQFYKENKCSNMNLFSPPLFNGKNFDIWSSRMKAHHIFRMWIPEEIMFYYKLMWKHTNEHEEDKIMKAKSNLVHYDIPLKQQLKTCLN